MPFDAIPSITINRSHFRAWLLRNRYEQVGIPRDSRFCPLANYMNDTYGYYWAVCSNYIGHKTAPYEVLSLPSWMSSFIKAIDRGGATKWQRWRRRMTCRMLDVYTGREALAILDNI